MAGGGVGGEGGWFGAATFFVCHSWEDDWRSVVDAICEHSARYQVRPAPAGPVAAPGYPPP